MDPIGGASLFQNQFIKVALRTIRDVEQYPRHADHLLRAIALDIYGAACQVIGAFRATTLAIHLLRAIARVYDDRNIISAVTISLIILIP